MRASDLYFTEDQAVALSRITKRQLRYWQDTNVFRPQLRSDPEDILYTFRDLVGLRTLSTLRTKTSLQGLRKLGHWLRTRYEQPWAALRFYLVGRNIQFDDPVSGRRLEAKPPGQVVVPFQMQQVADEMDSAVRLFFRRSEADVGKISKTRGVARSATVIAGTRIPTSAILSIYKRSGVDGIIKEYPTLTREDIDAALDYERDRRRARAG